MVHHHSGAKSIRKVKQGVVLKHPVDTGCRFKITMSLMFCVYKKYSYMGF